VPDKLEVLSGQGLVARFDDVAVWAGPQASAALQAHLVSEAQRTGKGPNGGDQLASSLIAVLQRGDPEPQAPFAVVGPGANGMTLFLHGPVQAWDSGRWLAPQPVPGWMVTSIGRPWPLIVLPYGASPPPQSQQGNPLDLLVGAVPGSGFVMLRPPGAPGQMGGAPQAATAPQPSPGGYGTAAAGSALAGAGMAGAGVAGGSAAGASTAGGSTAGGSTAGGSVAGTGVGGAGGPGAGGADAGGIGAGGIGAGGAGAGAAEVAAAGLAGAAVGMAAAGSTAYAEPAVAQVPQDAAAGLQAQSGGAGATPLAQEIPFAGAPQVATTVDLRNVFSVGRGPLALASGATSLYALDQPQVTGVRCELGHFNHPRVTNCLRCGRPIPPGTLQVSGPRPPVGVLLADDGSIWALSRGCLIGAEPTLAAEVQSGAAQAIAMKPGTNHAMAPVQAEVQIRDWSTYLVDKGAEGGTWVQGPTAQDWEQLGRNDQRELADGSHLSCGGRVLTYLAAWPA
jgi:hypothetical protein